MRSFLPVLAIFAFVSGLNGQQLPDSTFRFKNDHAAFSPGAGPSICVDAAHHNFHTLEGRYYSFGKLVREDGFRTTSLKARLDEAVLSDCAVIVIANALAAPAEERGADLNAPAFRPGEINRILEWVIGGGRLFLVIDHAPSAAAAANLAAAIGVLPLNGNASYRMFGELPDAAIRAIIEQHGITADSIRRVLGPLGSLGDHAILRGRPGVDRPVRTLLTFVGSALYPAEDVRSLLEVPTRSKGTVWLTGPSRPHSPRYPLERWLVGGAREMGAGRVVILSEAAMCSAQLAGPERNPMGMNDPLAVDNARFCLNVIRWLAGVI
ncbi:MAG TPA: hypothetical protein VES88_01045 [Gemmatimonadaceae bacterium]|nr:hypothetical protein [Gemmatimonadaceae bacterium]